MSSISYIGLGSNLGDRAGNLLMAIRGICDAGMEVIRLSRIYETEPFETVPQPEFLNMVVETRCLSPKEPEEIMQQLLQIEESLGRRRDITKGPRTIDLDLLLVGNETRNSELLKLPHPQLHRRRFVLTPLAELAPDVVHPVLNQAIGSLLEILDDTSAVKVWTP